MTPQEIAEQHMKAVQEHRAPEREARAQEEAEADRAFAEKVERTPSAQAEDIAAKREQACSEIAEDRAALDPRLERQMAEHIDKALDPEQGGKSFDDRVADAMKTAPAPHLTPPAMSYRPKSLEQAQAEVTHNLGAAAYAAHKEAYEGEHARLDQDREQVDRDARRDLVHAAVNEAKVEMTTPQHEPARSDTVLHSADDVLMSHGQGENTPSAKINLPPSLETVQGQEAKAEFETLYGNASPQTQDYVHRVAREAEELTARETAEFKNPDYTAARYQEALEAESAKPSAEGLEAGALEERAKERVVEDHQDRLEDIQSGAHQQIVAALRSDENNRDQENGALPLDPRTNSPEAQEEAVRKVEARLEWQRQMSREFNERSA